MNVSTLTMRAQVAPRAARAQQLKKSGLAASSSSTPRLPLRFPSLPAKPRPSVLARHGDGDDDGPLPLLRLPRRSEDPIDLKKLKQTPHLGGKTIGEELALIQKEHKGAEAAARERMEKRLYTASRGGAWEGDVYVGRPGEKYDIMQILALVAFATPLIGLVAAFVTYGTYWGNYTL
jgi:hypothetical protein